MLRPTNILIVDSDARAAAAVADLLRAEGCGGVMIAADGMAVAEKTNGVTVDFVLLSVGAGMLPECVLRAREFRQRLLAPVVFILDEATRSELGKNGEVASYEYILKPVAARELRIVLDAAQRVHALESRMRQIEAKMQEAQRLEGIGVMAGGIAHDFNNLLTGIFGAVAIAQQEAPVGSAVLQRLEHIERAATRAAELCQRLQAQIGHGASALTLLSVDGLVNDAVKLAQSSFKPGISLQTGFAGNLPSVRGNEAQLRQVVVNLVINAAEAIGTAGGMIRVVTYTKQLDAGGLAPLQFCDEARPGDYVVVEIADTGGGMEEKNLPKIFDPAFTTKAAGRGMGLPAAGRIVRKHHGGLSVESIPGRGSVFRFFLPVVWAASSLPATVAPMNLTPGVGSTVLVVDDDETVRALSKWVVEKANYRAVTARDGDEALRVYKANREQFCLVLLDLTMPRMGGAAVAAELHALGNQVPVVIISGHGEEVMAAEIHAGVVDYLQKPFGPEQLRAIMKRHLPPPSS